MIQGAKVVRHLKNGRIGWVIAEKSDGPRPAYRVLTTEGQQTWWQKARVEEVKSLDKQ